MTSQFESEHARVQVERILAYCAVTGAAFLASREGDVVMATGDGERTLLQAAALHVASQHRLREQDFSVCGATPWSSPFAGGHFYSAEVGSFLLCVLVDEPIAPRAIMERLERAQSLLRGMLAAATPPGEDGAGAPANAGIAWAWAPRRRDPMKH